MKSKIFKSEDGKSDYHFEIKIESNDGHKYSLDHYKNNVWCRITEFFDYKESKKSFLPAELHEEFDRIFDKLERIRNFQ